MGFRKFGFWSFEIHIRLFEVLPLDFTPSSQLEEKKKTKEVCGSNVF